MGQHFPKVPHPITNCQGWPLREAPACEGEQQFLPGLLPLPVALPGMVLWDGVLWRKRSQGMASDKGHWCVERIVSLKETCRLWNELVQGTTAQPRVVPLERNPGGFAEQ